MKKISSRINNKVYDAAAGPMYLILFGIPFLLVVAVVVLIVVVVKLIKRARTNNLRTEYRTKDGDSPGQGE